MRIKWNVVTWYSKLAAVVVFGAVLAVGVYIGRQYEGWRRDVGEQTRRDAQSPAAVLVKTAPSVVGHYESVGGEADLTVTAIDATRVRVTGLATWHGAGDMVNTGELNGEAVLNGRVATYSNGDCAATLTFGPATLAVEDNLKCGGLNVTFTGAYVRKSIE